MTRQQLYAQQVSQMTCLCTTFSLLPAVVFSNTIVTIKKKKKKKHKNKRTKKDKERPFNKKGNTKKKPNNKNINKGRKKI